MFGLNKGGGAGAMGGMRPMPRPAMAGGVPAPQAAPQRQGLFGGNMSSQARYDMTMELLKAGMSSAAQSNSPLAAFLAPMAGAVIGGRALQSREAAEAQEQDALSEALMPGGMSPRAEQLIDMLENENLPKAMRAVANAQLKDELESAMTPTKGGGKPSGGAKRGGSGVSGGIRIYGEYDIDGIIHGRDGNGVMRPYTDPNGKPVKAGQSGGKSTTAATDPLGLNSGAAVEDPLGIR